MKRASGSILLDHVPSLATTLGRKGADSFASSFTLGGHSLLGGKMSDEKKCEQPCHDTGHGENEISL